MLRLVKVGKKAIGVHCWTHREYQGGDRAARRSRSWTIRADIEICQIMKEKRAFCEGDDPGNGVVELSFRRG